MLCRWCGAKIELTELDDCQIIQFQNFTQDCALYISPPVGIPFDFIVSKSSRLKFWLVDKFSNVFLYNVYVRRLDFKNAR